MSGFLLFALGLLCGAGFALALRKGSGERDLTGPPRAFSRPRPVSPPPMPLIDAAAASRDEQMLDLIRRGRKIEAIKRLRDLTGLGLRDAKDAVEAIERVAS